MKYILALFLLLPTHIFAQQETPKERRTNLFISVSQGLSFMHREALSNTSNKTFSTSPGYAYTLATGVNILSKRRRDFSQITIDYRSSSNAIKNIVDPSSALGTSSRTSYNRFNFFSLTYRYSRYFKTIKDLNTFFGLGIQASYILNERKKLNYENRSITITTDGRNFSENFVIMTSPTFIFSYGVQFDKKIMIWKKSQISLDLFWDIFSFGIIRSPANQYFATMLSYKLFF